MEPAGISVAAVAKAVEAVSLIISSPLGNTLIICKQSFLDILLYLVLMEYFCRYSALGCIKFEGTSESS